MARAEVGDDVYGEDPTVLALQERVAGHVRPRGRAVHARPARWPTCSPSRRVVAPGAGGAVRVLGPHRARRARRPRRDQRASRCAPGPARAARSTCRRSRRCTPPTWARSSSAPPRSRSRTPTTSPAARCCRSRTCATCAPGPTPTGTADPPRRRPALERARRDRHAARGLRRGSPTCSRSACPRASARPIGSLMVGSADAIDRGAGAAQADGRRDAPGRRARGGRGVRPRPPRRAAGRRPRPRPAARRGAAASTRRRVDTNIVVVDRPDAAAFVAAAADEGVRIAAVGPRAVRLVTHLDVTPADAERAAVVLSRLAAR